MAAYASLVSLTHILDQVLHPPPGHPIIIDREKIESLREKVGWLIDFLENYSASRSKEYENLESRIADTAYSAEDLIESDVVSQIHAEYRTREKGGSTITRRGIQTAIDKFLSIQKKLLEIKDKKEVKALQLKSPTSASSSTPLANGNPTMVGFDKHLIQIMSELSTDESNRQIIPIVGMGGIGKTTLATAVYNNPFIVENFHVPAWVTVSQEYNVRELLLRLLYQSNEAGPNKQERSKNLEKFTDEMREKSDDELGLLLHKGLFDRKYLIVMDDMWNMKAWEKLKMFLPDNKNGSRILITTRLSNLTVDYEFCTPYKMDFLDEGQSWDLLRKMVFAEEDCPVELEEIGKSIAKRCSGLPLALVVIGGLLEKSERTREHWESVEGDVTSALNYGNDEHLMKVLSLSYIHLPVYLKPCFLYLAVFPEDFEIRVSTLVRLWAAEGFIKPTQAKCLEEVAHEYLGYLISRNLLLVHKRGSSGKVRCCKIHDLLRDLCIRESEKEKFLYIPKLENPIISTYIEAERRLSFSSSKRVEKEVCNALRSAALNRSWLNFAKSSRIFAKVLSESFGSFTNPIIHSFRLLRVVNENDGFSSGMRIEKLNNLRYVCTKGLKGNWSMPAFWNLQILVLPGGLIYRDDIWQMPQLRHLKISEAYIQDPEDNAGMAGQSVMVLENLQTLSNIINFSCSQQVVKRIPNLKKLRISYDLKSAGIESSLVRLCGQVRHYRLNNLVHLHKLESLRIKGGKKLWTIAFPSSLKKLTLEDCKIPWEDLSINVGSLPNLEVLKLYERATKGVEWNPIEGEFCRLKFLLICNSGLEIWRAENSHFPSLEHLVLVWCWRLKEIPTSFAEILTLQVIELSWRNSPLWDSAKDISDERELLGYDGLQLRHYSGGFGNYSDFFGDRQKGDEMSKIESKLRGKQISQLGNGTSYFSHKLTGH